MIPREEILCKKTFIWQKRMSALYTEQNTARYPEQKKVLKNVLKINVIENTVFSKMGGK